MYPIQSNIGVNSANTNPNNPIDRIEGKIAIAINKPSLKFSQMFVNKLGACFTVSCASFQAADRRLPSGFTSGCGSESL